jgi:hypothetical protein
MSCVVEDATIIIWNNSRPLKRSFVNHVHGERGIDCRSVYIMVLAERLEMWLEEKTYTLTAHGQIVAKS